MSLGSIYVVAPISSHKGITMKIQDGLLSAVFDRVAGDGVGVDGGKENETELYTCTQSQEALVNAATLPLTHACHHNNHSVSWDKRQTKKWCPERILTWNGSYGIYFFKCLNRPRPSAKNVNSIATVLKSIPSRLLKLAQGWEVAAFLVLPYSQSFEFSKILSYLDGGSAPVTIPSHSYPLSDAQIYKTSCSLAKWGSKAGMASRTAHHGAERKQPLFQCLSAIPLPSVHDILKVIWDSLFPQTATSMQKFRSHSRNIL